jgi:HAD superfamily hydrolase (TIGR01509 family)
MQDSRPKTLVLDAMGVIYPFTDDVTQLLIPFIGEKGGTRDQELIQAEYRSASLGRIASFQFWERVGLKHAVEDEYLSRFRLSQGLLEFLRKVNSRGIAVWCLSNDVSEWSRKLRNRFGLDRHFQGFLVSGDVMARKPDPAIYRFLLKAAEADAREVLFVDDREVNLDAAAALGYRTARFAQFDAQMSQGKHRTARSFAELLTML